jgi:LuxR family maltose regulon positive regulatory protein
LALQAEGRTEAARTAWREARELGADAGVGRWFAQAQPEAEEQPPGLSGHAPSAPAARSGGAVEPFPLLLSRKEKQVARHLVRGATSQEIAERLYVSLSTIKTHTKNIYAKLGVNRRLQAIEVLLKLDLA